MITTRGAEPENEALDGSVCMLPLFGELQEISLSIVWMHQKYTYLLEEQEYSFLKKAIHIQCAITNMRNIYHENIVR